MKARLADPLTQACRWREMFAGMILIPMMLKENIDDIFTGDVCVNFAFMDGAAK